MSEGSLIVVENSRYRTWAVKRMSNKSRMLCNEVYNNCARRRQANQEQATQAVSPILPDNSVTAAIKINVRVTTYVCTERIFDSRLFMDNKTILKKTPIEV